MPVLLYNSADEQRIKTVGYRLERDRQKDMPERDSYGEERSQESGQDRPERVRCEEKRPKRRYRQKEKGQNETARGRRGQKETARGRRGQKETARERRGQKETARWRRGQKETAMWRRGQKEKARGAKVRKGSLTKIVISTFIRSKCVTS